MRFLSFLFLAGLAGLVGFFAYYNTGSVSLNMFGYVQTLPVALLALLVYVVGMLSGWAVVGMVRRSWQRVTEHEAPPPRRA